MPTQTMPTQTTPSRTMPTTETTPTAPPATTSQEFHGLEDLVARLDCAVEERSVEDVTLAVRDSLTELIESRALDLPADLKNPHRDHYARRLLYKSPDHGYTVIAMVWGPHQSTPLHDHAGVWCVEAVLEGEIDVTQYDVLERRDDHWRFCPQGTVHARIGAAGCLIPPFEYHTIANACGEETAITLHVYGQEMTQCTVFETAADGWYVERTRSLGYH